MLADKIKLNSITYYSFIFLFLTVLSVPFNLINIKLANIPLQFLYFGIFVTILGTLSFLQYPNFTDFDKWLILLTLVFSLSLITSIDRIHTVRVLMGFFLKGMAIAFITERISRFRIHSTIVVFIYSLSIIALFGLGAMIYGKLIYYSPDEWPLYIRTSLVGNQLTLAACLVLFLPLSLWYFRNKKNIIKLLPILLLTFGILFSFSRSGCVSLFSALIIYSLRKDFLKKILRKWIYPFSFIILIIVSFFIIPQSWQGRFKSKFNIEMFTSKSFSHRLKSFITVKNIVQDYPLFGVGFGNYPKVHEKYMVEGIIRETPTPDNMYLRLFADAGIIGGLVFISFLIFWLYQLWKNRNNLIVWAIFCGMIGFLINLLAADLFLWTIPQFTFWMLLGLGVNIINGISDKDR